MIIVYSRCGWPIFFKRWCIGQTNVDVHLDSIINSTCSIPKKNISIFNVTDSHYSLNSFFFSLRNRIVTEHFHFTSIKSFNLLHVNAKALISRNEGAGAYNYFLKETGKLVEDLPYAEAQNAIESLVITRILENPVEYIVMHLKGSLMMLFDPGRFDLAHAYGIKGPGGFAIMNEGGSFVNLINSYPLNFLGLFVVIGCFQLLVVIGATYYCLMARSPSSTLVIAFVGYFILVAGPIGASRYRLPVQPVLLIAMAAGLQRMADRRSQVGLNQ